MLTEILSRESCAKCKVCCVFDREDCWEMPLIKPELAAELERSRPDVKINKIGACGVFEPSFGEDGLAKCPMLTEKGCGLGESKPFDCRVWPFRVMKKGGLLLLTLSPVCETVSGLSVSEISAFAKKISDKIFDEAKADPETIKDYVDGYPVFDVREM
ncbi:MAG: hypothetical protein NC394_05905 [Bacteroides sp.]|nr:hypothetical protein [Bacteroides sp.]